jgi:Eco57I restriction-modification methylase
VRTLRAAAELLAGARSLPNLIPIAAAAGCPGEASPIDADTRRALGLGVEAIDVRIASGPGALRALLLELRSEIPIRDLLPRIAARLGARAPHVLWLIVATQPGAGAVALAAWTDERRPFRLSLLVADRARIVDSDAETLRALAAAGHERDLMAHARWVELLGRDALSRRFYHTLERVVGAMGDSSAAGTGDERAEVALLYASRLLFLAFLEAKGWLNADHAFLIRQFDQCMTHGGGFHRHVLYPLFFGTLNTPVRRRAPLARQFGRIPFLNGGLFARTALERRLHALTFSDETYGSLLHDLFGQYRFTAREESASLNEAAVDPEMLGKAFESLMAARERRASGAYYTPQPLVERVTAAGLERLIARAAGDHAAELLLRGSSLPSAPAALVRTRLEQLTLLDPACGSGAFLVHALERVARLLSDLGDRRAAGAIRRDVLTRSIFGVDLNPTAVWLCELRLWLSVVIESDDDVDAIPPLPNLDHNVRVGDALAGTAFADTRAPAPGGIALRALRQRYATASGARKESLGRRLDAAERQNMLASIDAELVAATARRRDLVALRRGHDLFGVRHNTTSSEREAVREIRARIASLRATRRRIADGGPLPFAFAAHFADVAARGGFDVVVGNPPWVRPHRLSAAAREQYRRSYVVARDAAWAVGAIASAAGNGFGGQIDLAALFVERSLRLLAPGAALALLVPVKLWRSLAGGGMRRLLSRDARLHRLDDYSGGLSAFDAAAYPSLIVAMRTGGDVDVAHSPVIVASVGRRAATFEWRTGAAAIHFDESPGAPWIVIPPEPRRAFDRLRIAGRALGETSFGRPLLGVKCGCNDAFVVRVVDRRDDVSGVIARDGRAGIIETRLLRPLRRGEGLTPWVTTPPPESIVWTHDGRGAPLASLPPHAAVWLEHWRRELASRTDARRANRGWTLFRTESARCDRPRVIWADIGRAPRATVLHVGDDTVALNSCYVALARDERDAHALAALLNSPVAAAWLSAIAEPARAGYRRYLGWTMALFPIPADWGRARDVLAPIGQRALGGAPIPSEHELLEPVIDAYGLSRRDIAPLVAWLSG